MRARGLRAQTAGPRQVEFMGIDDGFQVGRVLAGHRKVQLDGRRSDQSMKSSFA